MNTSDIRSKITQFQSTLSLLQKEERNLLGELDALGIKSIDEAKVYLEKLSKEDISKLEQEVLELEIELKKWLS